MEGKVIYPTSDEKLVNAVVLFAGTEGGLFYDEALLKPVSTDEALNLFKKGLILVSVDGGFKRPTGITVTEDGYTIVYGEGGGSSDDTVIVNIKVSDGFSSAEAYIDDEVVYFNEIKEKCEGKKIYCTFSLGTESTIHGALYQPAFTESLEAPDGSTFTVFANYGTNDSFTIIQIDIGVDSESTEVRTYSLTLNS